MWCIAAAAAAAAVVVELTLCCCCGLRWLEKALDWIELVELFIMAPTTVTGECCMPAGCLHAEEPLVMYDVVKVACNNEHCTVSGLMHRPCFESWETAVLNYLRSCGRARSWSERQRQQNLWTKKGYDLAFKVWPVVPSKLLSCGHWPLVTELVVGLGTNIGGLLSRRAAVSAVGVIFARTWIGQRPRGRSIPNRTLARRTAIIRKNRPPIPDAPPRPPLPPFAKSITTRPRICWTASVTGPIVCHRQDRDRPDPARHLNWSSPPVPSAPAFFSNVVLTSTDWMNARGWWSFLFFFSLLFSLLPLPPPPLYFLIYCRLLTCTNVLQLNLTTATSHPLPISNFRPIHPFSSPTHPIIDYSAPTDCHLS